MSADIDQKMLKSLAEALADAQNCDCEPKRPIFCMTPKPGQCKGPRHGRILLEFRTVCCGRILVSMKGCDLCLLDDKQAQRTCDWAGNVLATRLDLEDKPKQNTIQN